MGESTAIATEISDVLNGRARWCVVTGDLRDVLPTMGGGCVHCIITDPPYSAKVHASVRSAKRNEAPDVGKFECRTRRVVDLGFMHLSPRLRSLCAREFARLGTRWTLVFSDDRGACWWRLALESAGLNYLRTGAWDRIGGAPQFTGTEPSAPCEWITMCHLPGRRHWNGGGKRAMYSHPIVANRLGQRNSRVHPTQKPIGLMVDLVQDFTDPNDIVLDPFAGSGTTGEACLLLGRRFVGVELDPNHADTARARLDRVTETLPGANYRRAKQETMFHK